MSSELTEWAANAGEGLKTNYILQSAATSTVAGGTQTANNDGEYIWTVDGTFNGATANLYVRSVGQPSFSIYRDDTTGVTAAISTQGSKTIRLARGDRFYQQLASVGASTSLTGTLNIANGD